MQLPIMLQQLALGSPILTDCIIRVCEVSLRPVILSKMLAEYRNGAAFGKGAKEPDLKGKKT